MVAMDGMTAMIAMGGMMVIMAIMATPATAVATTVPKSRKVTATVSIVVGKMPDRTGELTRTIPAITSMAARLTVKDSGADSSKSIASTSLVLGKRSALQI